MTNTTSQKEMAATVSAVEAIGGTQKHCQSSANSTTAEYLSNHQKQIANLKAQLALLGHELRTVTRAEDARLTFVVSRWNESRTFSSTHDLQAFANQIGGVK